VFAAIKRAAVLAIAYLGSMYTHAIYDLGVGGIAVLNKLLKAQLPPSAAVDEIVYLVDASAWARQLGAAATMDSLRTRLLPSLRDTAAVPARNRILLTFDQSSLMPLAVPAPATDGAAEEAAARCLLTAADLRQLSVLAVEASPVLQWQWLCCLSAQLPELAQRDSQVEILRAPSPSTLPRTSEAYVKALDAMETELACEVAPLIKKLAMLAPNTRMLTMFRARIYAQQVLASNIFCGPQPASNLEPKKVPDTSKLLQTTSHAINASSVDQAVRYLANLILSPSNKGNTRNQKQYVWVTANPLALSTLMFELARAAAEKSPGWQARLVDGKFFYCSEPGGMVLDICAYTKQLSQHVTKHISTKGLPTTRIEPLICAWHACAVIADADNALAVGLWQASAASRSNGCIFTAVDKLKPTADIRRWIHCGLALALNPAEKRPSKVDVFSILYRATLEQKNVRLVKTLLLRGETMLHRLVLAQKKPSTDHLANTIDCFLGAQGEAYAYNPVAATTADAIGRLLTDATQRYYIDLRAFGVAHGGISAWTLVDLNA